MNSIRTSSFIVACALGALASRGNAQTATGLTSTNQLVTFRVGAPATLTTPVAITGLGVGETIVGLDYRPANRTLVGLTNLSRVVVVNPTTGAATPLSTLSVTLSGTAFGVDFNPVPDRLRIVSNAGQNLRVNVDTGAVTTDTSLAFVAGDPNFGTVPQVTAAGYTNSVAGTPVTTTTLYDIDATLDVLVRQNPPNNGVLTTVGALGVDFGTDTGFDVFSPTTAYAVASVGGASNLYTISLTTGAATLVGGFSVGTTLVDLAVRPKEPQLGVVNASARGMISPGEGAVIAGFVILGTDPVNVVITARGPSLTQFGVVNAIADTKVSVYAGSSLLEENDDWQTHARAAEVTASGFAPGDSKESSVILSLPPGLYTAVVSGAGMATDGVAIVEVYELP